MDFLLPRVGMLRSDYSRNDNKNLTYEEVITTGVTILRIKADYGGKAVIGSEKK